MSQESAQQVPVKIQVTTHIYNGKNKESIEWIGFGQYLVKDGKSFLKYEEIIEEGSIKTIIKIADNEALILRSGAVKMRLPLLIQKQGVGSYESPYGTFQLWTSTKRLTFELYATELSGELDILYELTMQGKNNGTYHMTIVFKEEKESS